MVANDFVLSLPTVHLLVLVELQIKMLSVPFQVLNFYKHVHSFTMILWMAQIQGAENHQYIDTLKLFINEKKWKALQSVTEWRQQYCSEI
jgi:hypothetical protein